MSVAAIIGGGFYGASIALYLKRSRGIDQVVLLEREASLLSRSSRTNQARVHRGYHYPRSFTTGYRSMTNAPRFQADFAPALQSSFTNLYAVARRNSKITSRQMERFCQEIGATLSPVSPELAALFSPALVESVYHAEEQAFDAEILRRMLMRQLAEAGVEILTGREASLLSHSDDGVRIGIAGGGEARELTADFAFNCTYSRLQTFLGDSAGAEPLGLKHEISEMLLIEPPPALSGLGVTVMDGPFFSMMPFPVRGLHSLSHVRYTPHNHWNEDGSDPYRALSDYERESRADRMIRDAARYLPAIAQARPRESLFEVKTVLTRNEGDDGRPILLRRHGPHGRLFSVLGGKIDNIYDIFEKLDEESLSTGRGAPQWTH
ncbi:MAG: amino acid oxidase family protein [Alphaproteobacteria bacterium]|nr:amino acid oxidase family protein [Alphaproteobacteria bacterium]